eukprot:95281_1
MSLYAFEDTIVYRVIFVLFFIVMIVLFSLSILCIYRQYHVKDAETKLNVVRYIVAWCLLLQFFTFLGYFIGCVPLFAILWNLWVPSWSIGYVFLSLNISLIQASQLSTTMDNNHQVAKWKIIWCFWAGCSLSEWIGSISGWTFNLHNVQAFGYLFWKVNALIMLILCVTILVECYKNIKELSDVTTEEDAKNDMARGLRRMKHLIMVELILSLYLFISVVYEIYVIICIYKHIVFNNIYVEEATVMKMVVYFPLWSLINVVLLIYSWIPKTTSSKSEIQLSQNSKSDPKVEPFSYCKHSDSK